MNSKKVFKLRTEDRNDRDEWIKTINILSNYYKSL